MRFTIKIAIMIVIATIGVQAKPTAVVFNFDSVGADSQTVEAASQIFRAELAATEKYNVLTRGDLESRLSQADIYNFNCYDIGCAVSRGKTIGADKAVIGSLTRLGDKIIAQVQLIDVKGKKVEFDDRFSADTIDDLDVVLRRLAEAMVSGNKVETNVNKFALTEQETESSRQRKSFITSGFSFGFGFPLGDSYSNVDNLKQLAWNMRYEAGRYVVDNSVGINWGSAEVTVGPDSSDTEHKGVFIIPWDIGLRYILAPKSEISPYIGAGIGFHFIFAAKINDTPVVDGDQAMALHLAAGLYAFQSYDFRFTVDAKYTIVFSDAFYGSDSNSQQIGISVGISRKWESGKKRIFFIF